LKVVGVSVKSNMYSPEQMRANWATHFGPIGYDLNYLFDFEKLTAGYEDSFHEWTKNNFHLCVYTSVAYMMFVYFGLKHMKHRPPYSLRIPLTIWSAFLAVYSILGTIRTLPEMVGTIQLYGVHVSLCTTTYAYGATGFWTILFHLSKIVELGDTVFIIVRKRPLIFLHWYHHVTVMLFVWISNIEYAAPGRWFQVMNYFVHAFMYTYYTMRALQIRVPTQISMFITSLQIIQMFVGNGIFFYLFYNRFLGPDTYCEISSSNMVYGILMYGSYLILFMNFFLKSYVFTARRKVESHHQKNGHSSSMVHQNGHSKLD
jgi:elongation of very long chain fatty acids protein 6